MTVFPFLPLLLLLLNSWILFLFTFVLPTFLPLVFIFLVDFIFWSFSLFWFQCWLGGKNQLSILFFGFPLFVFPLLALLLLVCRHLCFSSTSRCTLKLAFFYLLDFLSFYDMLFFYFCFSWCLQMSWLSFTWLSPLRLHVFLLQGVLQSFIIILFLLPFASIFFAVSQ